MASASLTAEEKREDRKKRAVLGPLPESFLRIPGQLIDRLNGDCEFNRWGKERGPKKAKMLGPLARILSQNTG
jgi:hypothetical protein